ncbi:hypothetical protein [Streptomyces sp. SPB074]|uniref:hypothetical protein n=1 Tax=Streptomyces sp. (strain SPB074) TaxID=465543 RepID=UPI00017F2779|nr:hypothetical protein [Streptomyces sp. SPB074]EDY43877.1 hypothetical protein SSBG_01759 [Streptomyces sp. SPB074]
MSDTAHDVLVKLLRDARATGSGGRPLMPPEWSAHMEVIARRAAELDREEAREEEFAPAREDEKERV